MKIIITERQHKLLTEDFSKMESFISEVQRVLKNGENMGWFITRHRGYTLDEMISVIRELCDKYEGE